jgi:hypothetical protein
MTGSNGLRQRCLGGADRHRGFLWPAHLLTLREQALGAAGIVALPWALGALT